MKAYMPALLLVLGLVISPFFYTASEDGSGSLLTVAISVVAAVIALVVSLINKQMWWLLISGLMFVLLPVFSVWLAAAL
ncbi:hypothetical protein [Motilimonas pumila]|uniref:Uncharacterized protein n=1 Tax=Motilimonas pumila TaxID=2303987 RepID=A0A418YIV3_9GAMM|nr:hypothetical protein [Motilimonas pumila]RJG50549.1 hypothetical protein D1Z90_03455 [Motilimonas pumila]